jgi:hypothetical protein
MFSNLLDASECMISASISAASFRSVGGIRLSGSKLPCCSGLIDEFGGRIDRCSEILEFGIDDGRLYAIECVAALHATNMPDGQRLGALYSVKK